MTHNFLAQTLCTRYNFGKGLKYSDPGYPSNQLILNKGKIFLKHYDMRIILFLHAHTQKTPLRWFSICVARTRYID